MRKPEYANAQTLHSWVDIFVRLHSNRKGVKSEKHRPMKTYMAQSTALPTAQTHCFGVFKIPLYTSRIDADSIATSQPTHTHVLHNNGTIHDSFRKVDWPVTMCVKIKSATFSTLLTVHHGTGTRPINALETKNKLTPSRTTFVGKAFVILHF